MRADKHGHSLALVRGGRERAAPAVLRVRALRAPRREVREADRSQRADDARHGHGRARVEERVRAEFVVRAVLEDEAHDGLAARGGLPHLEHRRGGVLDYFMHAWVRQ